MRIEKFDISHLNDFTFNGLESDMSTPTEVKRNLLNFQKIGKVYSGLVNGKAVTFGGIFECYPGVGQCFLYFNLEAKPYIKTAYKTMLKIVYDNHFRRVQAICLCNSDKATRLLEHLGFQKEGVMRFFTEKGEDMFLYSIIKRGLLGG